MANPSKQLLDTADLLLLEGQLDSVSLTLAKVYQSLSSAKKEGRIYPELIAVYNGLSQDYYAIEQYIFCLKQILNDKSRQE